jgi:hypothetical protein
MSKKHSTERRSEAAALHLPEMPSSRSHHVYRDIRRCWMPADGEQGTQSRIQDGPRSEPSTPK